MPSTPPYFWYDQTRPTSKLAKRLLNPLAGLWRATSALRHKFAQPQGARVPVICLGNVVAGGTGKTPSAIALVQLLRAAGVTQTPFFVSRGYGGQQKAPSLVERNAADAYARFGDEPLLLARHAPTIVARNRAAGIAVASQMGADLVITDDGFQNPHFEKTCSILVFDGAMGIGNGACIPAGPCREPLGRAIKRAQGAIIVGRDRCDIQRQLGSLPVFEGQITPKAIIPPGPCMAFAGIGRPDKFFDTLRADGFMVLEAHTFADHHPYSEADIAPLIARSQQRHAPLMTTEKDAVRLSPAMRTHVVALPIALQISQEDRLVDLIKRSIDGFSAI